MRIATLALALALLAPLLTGRSCTPHPSPTPITSGLWTAPVAFGTISFVVDGTGTGLTEVGFDLDWECGSQFLHGPITFVPGGPPWRIQDRSFAVTIDVPGGRPLKKVFIQGSFSTTGRSASGIWRGVSPLDEPCELSWQAAPAAG